MSHQDWTPVVVRKSARIETAKKSNVSQDAQHQRKLDSEEIPRPKMLSSESRAELVKLRLSLQLTQSQLDQRCAFPTHTVRDIEANKRAPTMKELNMLNRVLKAGLKLETH